MKIITIVYFSGTGNTKLGAEAVLQGCQTVDGVSVQLLKIVGTDIIEGRWVNEDIATALDSSDAIIFGTPTYMGSVARPDENLHECHGPPLVHLSMERQDRCRLLRFFPSSGRQAQCTTNDIGVQHANGHDMGWYRRELLSGCQCTWLLFRRRLTEQDGPTGRGFFRARYQYGRISR